MKRLREWWCRVRHWSWIRDYERAERRPNGFDGKRAASGEKDI